MDKYLWTNSTVVKIRCSVIHYICNSAYNINHYANTDKNRCKMCWNWTAAWKLFVELLWSCILCFCTKYNSHGNMILIDFTWTQFHFFSIKTAHRKFILQAVVLAVYFTFSCNYLYCTLCVSVCVRMHTLSLLTTPAAHHPGWDAVGSPSTRRTGCGVFHRAHLTSLLLQQVCQCPEDQDTHTHTATLVVNWCSTSSLLSSDIPGWIKVTWKHWQ